MRRVALAIGLSAAACAASGTPPEEESFSIDRPRGTFQVIPRQLLDDRAFVPVAGDGPVALAAARTIYMNKDGGAYTPGNNDSRTNRTTVIQDTRSIAAWQVDAGTWASVMSCVREQFAPYDVDITDVDPGDAPHIESVVAGSPGDLGLPDGVGGVSPFTPTCGMIANSIVFTFAESLPQSPEIVCEVAAQEISHSFGLDHEFLCEDPMTYLTGCGAKSFQNTFAPCGEFQQRASCAVPGKYDCGRDTQNSVQLLSQRLGLKPGQPPSVTIVAPADGAVVMPAFEVLAEAVDDQAVTEVELLVDGSSIATASASPYSFTAPADLPLGSHVVEVIARDGTDETSTSISVEIANDPGSDGGSSNPGDGDGGPGGAADPDGDGSTPPLVGGCTAGGSTAGGSTAGGSTAGGSTGPAWLLALIALVLSRRRRPPSRDGTG